ncbi:MAG: hypothetical protein JWP81_2335 [Ferruginibacter sp.]|nr:hypothetical protein [Ferruginibacter sp.]
MYSKQEASLLTQQFWTSFGQYLAPVFSAEGEKINWVNYKTGRKDIRFIMIADSKEVTISIVLSHKDLPLQQRYFEKFTQLKKIFHQFTGEEWQWQLHSSSLDGKIISTISTSLQQVNILNKDDWPAIISFLKPRLISLDEFWCEYKFVFEGVDLNE